MSRMYEEHRTINALLIVADSELKVTRDDTLLLVITGGVTRKLEDLGGKVLEDSSQIDYARQASRPLSATWPECIRRRRTWSTGTNTLSVVALLQETVDTTDGELETGLGGTGLGLAGLTTSLARRGLATA